MLSAGTKIRIIDIISPANLADQRREYNKEISENQRNQRKKNIKL